jgi:hypothetical protein
MEFGVSLLFIENYVEHLQWAKIVDDALDYLLNKRRRAGYLGSFPAVHFCNGRRY